MSTPLKISDDYVARPPRGWRGPDRPDFERAARLKAEAAERESRFWYTFLSGLVFFAILLGGCAFAWIATP